MLRIILVLLLLAVYISSIIDVAKANSQTVRILPKFVWLIIVIVLPVLGAVVWVIFGREDSARGGSGRGGQKYPKIGPEDDPDFLKKF